MPITVHPLFREDPARRLVGVGRDQSLIEQLRAEYAIARAAGEKLAASFYTRLFSQHPAVQPMFRHDPGVQQGKLMESLDAVMAFLDKPDDQLLYLRQMGARHAGYGALPVHYEIVSNLLADSMIEVLGDRAGPRARQDWYDAFRLISDQMLSGAGEG